ncbi:MAG: hypothetical protein A2Y38_02155 [Spirochaetes bacterium GWB1_59_5]|nr:MAG: hypothetical protein A2Y38_02155 [Spirochaetes bacterium GWB1_59_5]
MKSIYIAAPFRGPDGFIVYQNVVRTEQVMYELIKRALAQGTPVAVLCPHSMTFHFDRTFNDGYWLEATLEHMRRCDAILLVEGWAKSEGAKGEREEALAKGLPVFYNIREVLAWLRSREQVEPQDGASGCPPECHDCLGLHPGSEPTLPVVSSAEPEPAGPGHCHCHCC